MDSSKNISKCTIALVFVLSLISLPVFSQIFVATDGDDSNSGDMENPFATIKQAISVVSSGDTIFVRGGNYDLTATILIASTKSGKEDQRITLTGYQHERPLLDFSTQAFGSKGISLNASYWTIYGLDVKGSGDNGMMISGGSYNIIENCSFYENRDTGLQLGSGAAYNQIINCDSYYNADPTDYGDADGFAPKLDVGTGNSFYGCRAWGNCDDGWDGYMRGTTNVSTTLENCWTWGNGYFKDGSDAGEKANGNGFKMGGGDNSNSELLTHHMMLIRCVAFNNKSKGFDQNNNVGSMTLIHCSGYGNLSANYRIAKALAAGQTLTVTNCLSFNGSVYLGLFATQQNNSWMSDYSVAADDFVALDASVMAAPRQEDGSLPNVDFLHLATGSDLIDGGIDTGFPFEGSAPDLGAFESNYSLVADAFVPSAGGFVLHPNFPNPFNGGTQISYTLPKASHVRIAVYDVTGREICVLAEGPEQAGTHQVHFESTSMGSGMVFCLMEADGLRLMQRMVLLK